MIKLLISFSLIVSASALGAQQTSDETVRGYQSATDLLRKCRSKSSYGRSYCYAYLAAVADSVRAYDAWLGGGGPCLPEELTQGQLVDLFEEHLIANPSLQDAQAASVIVPAMQSAFPCEEVAAEAPVEPSPSDPAS